MKTPLKIFIKELKFKVLFFVLGTGSLIWFLIRVIPKPSRATYPCMRIAAPMASSLVLYLIGLGSFTLLLRKARDKFRKTKYLIATGLAFAGIMVGLLTQLSYNTRLNAQPLKSTFIPNNPIGEEVGIYPGRVVWIYDEDATNENCANQEGDYWWSDDNTNLAVVRDMLSKGLQDMTGTKGDDKAWDAIFKYHNNKKGKGNVGYTTGEKFVIKTNLNGEYNSWTSIPEKNVNTSPQITYAILDQLVNKAGVKQSDISIGDPNCAMNDQTYNFCATDFPNVTYWGSGPGREFVIQSSEKVFFASNGSAENYLPQSYIDATYMINIPVLKKHHRAGISISSKNHFGSIAPFSGGAWHLHPSLPCPEATAIADNGDYGVYRCFVDIMGHEHLGGKTILYLVDGLWGSTNWGHPPVKFRMLPFNNNWPSSLFLSQDPVAVESVCYDFLFKEFDESHPTEGEFLGDDKGPYPQFPGTNDFLQQAADPTLWPSDVEYDPEGDGSTLKSMGAYEHWNNAYDKQYSRNLGLNKGIELYSNLVITFSESNPVVHGYQIDGIYPNPFSQQVSIEYRFESAASFEVFVYNLSGALVYKKSVTDQPLASGSIEWDGMSNNGIVLPAGQYLLNLKVETKNGSVVLSDKLLKVN